MSRLAVTGRRLVVKDSPHPRFTPRPWHQMALALGGGALLAVSMPPRGWWLATVLGIALLAAAVRGGGRWRARGGLGVLAGAAFLGPSLVWLTSFSAPGYALVLLLEVAMFAGALTLLPARAWWALPSVLVLLEAVRTSFPFGGFPIPSLALAQVAGPFGAVAPLGGAPLIVAVTAAAGVGLTAVAVCRHRLLAVLVTAAAVAAPLAGAALVPSTRPAGEVRAGIVQGGGPRGIPAVFTDPSRVTERQFTTSGRLRRPLDLVLWPEDVVDVDGPVAASPAGSRLAQLARELDATVVAGVIEDDDGGFRNAAVAWGPDGRLLDRYEKVHRVPFGEYIPGRALFERLTDATALVPRDAIPGRGPGLLRTPAGPLGVAISYEVFFAHRVRAAVRAGGQLLLVPTNAASYTTDEVPATEVAAARLRAMESGRAVLQAAPTGYSAVIRPDGQVLRRTSLGAPAVLTATVPLRDGLTVYTRTGDWPVLVLAGLLLAACLGGPRRRLVRRRPARHGPTT